MDIGIIGSGEVAKTLVQHSLDVTRCGARTCRPCCAQTLRDQFTYATLGRQDTQEGQGAAVEDFIAIYEHRELAVVAFDKLDVHVQLTPQVGRHPGGLDTGDSIAAAADSDRHLYPLCGGCDDC